jgi:hypothetical protein
MHKPYRIHQKNPLRGKTDMNYRALLTCSNDSSQPDFVDYCTFAYKKKKKRTRTLDEDPQLDGSL